MTIQVKRVYEAATHADGMRVFVDGLWPRGMPAHALKVTDWMKDLAPSAALRKWFNHEPEKWAIFKSRYFKELDHHMDKVSVLIDDAKHSHLTLVYRAKDEIHNNAVALKEYVEQAMRAH